MTDEKKKGRAGYGNVSDRFQKYFRHIDQPEKRMTPQPWKVKTEVDLQDEYEQDDDEITQQVIVEDQDNQVFMPYFEVNKRYRVVAVDRVTWTITLEAEDGKGHPVAIIADIR